LPFFEAGAAGYIPKNAAPEEMINALYNIHAGRPSLPPPIASALVARMRELALQHADNMPPTETQLPEQIALTMRERQILELIGNGLSNQEIAMQLTIELGTVKNHVHKILKKLGASSRAQAAQYYALTYHDESFHMDGA
jgi:DNA-binding NarL/FixJ family response regulator